MTDENEADRVGLLAQIQVLEVEPEVRARVVIDERTGTIVVGSQVRIREVAIAQGGLTVTVSEAPQISQPNPLASGQTAQVESSTVTAETEGGAVRRIGPTASLDDVVSALNALGATPRELISIFQGMRTAGAITAEIEVQ